MAATTGAASIFVGDAAARALQQGTFFPVWGINVNVCSPPQKPLAEAYAGLFTEEKHAVEALLSTGKVYLYKKTALHFTVASPAPFTHTKVPQADKALQKELTAFWKRALEFASKNDREWPIKPFEVTAQALILEGKNAAYIDFRDDTGCVEALRRIMRKIAVDGCHDADKETLENPVVMARNRELLELGKFKTPFIFHATIMRFTEDVTDEAEAELVRRNFAILAAAWKPTTVPVDNIILVNEVSPCMSEERLHEEDVGSVAAKFVFGS
jgi:hypothetical protein